MIKAEAQKKILSQKRTWMEEPRKNQEETKKTLT